VVGILIFKAHTHGSWVLASLSLLLGILCFVAIGFMITGLVRTAEAARAIATFVTFPMMFLSGVFIPISQLPAGLQSLVHILPLTYLTDALHNVLNNGRGVSALWADWALLAAWSIVCFAIAARRFRWE
jgi:ABC-2 type transport system permease protein